MLDIMWRLWNEIKHSSKKTPKLYKKSPACCPELSKHTFLFHPWIVVPGMPSIRDLISLFHQGEIIKPDFTATVERLKSAQRGDGAQCYSWLTPALRLIPPWGEWLLMPPRSVNNQSDLQAVPGVQEVTPSSAASPDRSGEPEGSMPPCKGGIFIFSTFSIKCQCISCLIFTLSLFQRPPCV